MVRLLHTIAVIYTIWAVNGSVVLDQQQPECSDHYSVATETRILAQSFHLGSDGVLVAADLWLSGTEPFRTVNVEIQISRNLMEQKVIGTGICAPMAAP